MKGYNMRKKLKNVRNYDNLLSIVKTLDPVFTCLEFQTAADIKTKWNAYCALYHMHDQGLVYRKKRNGRDVKWSLYPMPAEEPKKALRRVFTTNDYGEYYSLSDPHRVLYRAAQRGIVFRVGRYNSNGPLLWSFDPADEGSEYALKRGVAGDIIPSEVKDPFANVFR
jgi:hypothetical protein